MFNIQSFTDISPSDGHVDEQLFHFNKVHLLLPIAAYAYVFHHSVPALSDSLRHKKHLVSVFAGTLIVCFVFYVIVGTVVSTYFKDRIHPASNLNWVTYVGDIANSRNDKVTLLARFISRFIVLFPALDVASAFPLNVSYKT